jgi:hypothetical protein
VMAVQINYNTPSRFIFPVLIKIISSLLVFPEAINAPRSKPILQKSWHYFNQKPPGKNFQNTFTICISLK